MGLNMRQWGSKKLTNELGLNMRRWGSSKMNNELDLNRRQWGSKKKRVMNWVWIWDNEEVTKWVMNWVWIGDNEAVRKWVMNCVWIGDNEAVIFSSVFCAEYDQHLQFAAYKLSVDGQICWKAHPKIRHIPSKLYANQKVYDGKMHTLLCTQRSGWNRRNSVLFYRVKDSKFTLCSVMSL